MKRIIYSILILSSLISFTSCGNTEKTYGRVIKTEVTDTIKGGDRIGGHMSFFTTSDKFVNKVTIKTSNGSEKTFEITTERNPYSNELIGDSVAIMNNLNGISLSKVIF